MQGREFDEIVADIEEHGLREPIWTYEGQILDGRNRFRACEVWDVEPIFREYAGEDPAKFVISLNLHRRHLNESQRALVAGRLATLQKGVNQHSPIGESTTQAQAAELLNVGKRSVERAREVIEHGTPELIEAVERGDVSVSAAADVVELPRNEQQEIVAKGESEIRSGAYWGMVTGPAILQERLISPLPILRLRKFRSTGKRNPCRQTRALPLTRARTCYAALADLLHTRPMYAR